MLRIVLLVCFVAISGAANAKVFSGMYVFGDSLSDQGNLFAASNGFPPYPDTSAFPSFVPSMRASNGPTAVEVLADQLGIALSASVVGGNNFAVAGAATREFQNLAPPPAEVVTGVPQPASITTSNFVPYRFWSLDGVSLNGGPPLRIANLTNLGLQSQIAQFLARPSAGDAADSLFFIWGGANDIFLGAGLAPQEQIQNAAIAAQNILGMIQALHGAGAQHFFVPNLPDLSQTPGGRALPVDAREGLRQLGQIYNSVLAAGLKQADALPDLEIIDFDTSGLLSSIIESQGGSIADLTTPCFQFPASMCTNPDEHLFWDDTHPTRIGHALLGQAFAARIASVPEPSTPFLLGISLLIALVLPLRTRRVW